MATYWNTLAFANALVLDLIDQPKERKIPSKTEKEEVREKLCQELGVTVPLLKNVFFRNVPESTKPEDVMFFQILKKEDARADIIPFINLVADGISVNWKPDIDIWEIKAPMSDIEKDKGEILWEDEQYVIKVQCQYKADGELKWPTGRAYMRIYQKPHEVTAEMNDTET